MRLLKIKIAIFLSGSILAFISCDPNGEYSYMVTNDSDTVISVVYSRQYNAIYRVNIASHSTDYVGGFAGLGVGGSDLGDQFLDGFDTLGIFLRGVRIKKDYRKRSFWHFHNHHDSFGDNSSTYTLVLNNRDL